MAPAPWASMGMNREFRAVVAFYQVNQFVQDDVVHPPDRELKDFPVEKEHAVLAAGAPAES